MTTRTEPTPPVLSLVIPMFDEGALVPIVLDRVRDILDGIGVPYEVVMVDDGSRDDTWERIASEAGRRAWLRGVRLSRNFGKEAALCAGLDVTRGRAVAIMDGDLQHPPDLIPEMFRRWKEGRADVVEAVKKERGDESRVYRLCARLFYGALRALSGFDMRAASDFKLLDRRVVEAWTRMGERNLFFRGMVAWLGFRRERIEFDVAERVAGRSRWSLFRLMRLAVTAVTSFSSSLLQIITLIGAVFMAFAMILAVQTLINKLTGVAVSGFTTVILLQLLIGSVVMISLGVIGEYLARIYEEVKGRPRYVVSDTTDDDPTPRRV